MPLPHYGIPSRPYQHGEARVKLVFCPSCRTYQTALHPCSETPPEENQ